MWMNQDRPLISVIMPIFNAERYVGEAIESVLSQSYRPIELILVDDGSTDESPEIASRFRSPAVRYHHQPNRGTGAARNAGVTLAQGSYFAHLDADDVWTEEKLVLQMAAFADDPLLDMVAGYVEEFHSPELDRSMRERMRQPRGCIPGRVVGAMLIGRDAHLRVGPFETQWDVGQDMSWYMRALEVGVRIRTLRKTVLHRRLHASNKGIVRRRSMDQRLHILKAGLDRRRKAKSALKPEGERAGKEGVLGTEPHR
jgi:glycosyltransferase involved in cell wall biosynthesis